MTDVAVAPGSCLDFEIPSSFRWRYGRVRSDPVQVPELATHEVVEPRHRGKSRRLRLDREVAQPVKASVEPRVEERDAPVVELGSINSLRSQISVLRQERNELLAETRALSAEVSCLRSKREELEALRSGIQDLHQRKSVLERSILSLRRQAGAIGGRTGHREFHDS